VLNFALVSTFLRQRVLI